MYNKRKVGDCYEEKAVLYLKGKGYKILSRNFRCRSGEIDIIAREGDTICFVEVKYRRNHCHGYPEEAVSYYKQETIRKVAQYYFVRYKLPFDTDCRFDVIAIEGEELRHIINAF